MARAQVQVRQVRPGGVPPGDAVQNLEERDEKLIEHPIQQGPAHCSPAKLLHTEQQVFVLL